MPIFKRGGYIETQAARSEAAMLERMLSTGGDNAMAAEWSQRLELLKEALGNE